MPASRAAAREPRHDAVSGASRMPRIRRDDAGTRRRSPVTVEPVVEAGELRKERQESFRRDAGQDEGDFAAPGRRASLAPRRIARRRRPCAHGRLRPAPTSTQAPSRVATVAISLSFPRNPAAPARLRQLRPHGRRRAGGRVGGLVKKRDAPHGRTAREGHRTSSCMAAEHSRHADRVVRFSDSASRGIRSLLHARRERRRTSPWPASRAAARCAISTTSGTPFSWSRATGSRPSTACSSREFRTRERSSRSSRTSGSGSSADVENHLIETEVERFPEELQSATRPLWPAAPSWSARPRSIPFECVARGYLAGSGWAEYRKTGEVCGIRLPPGLAEAERLPEPIFTPATKNERGHDENIPFARMANAVGTEEAAVAARDDARRSTRGRATEAEPRGLLLADTKLEFGRLDGRIIWIDEAFTPDSSRYWDSAALSAGPKPGLLRQAVRPGLARVDRLEQAAARAAAAGGRRPHDPGKVPRGIPPADGRASRHLTG